MTSNPTNDRTASPLRGLPITDCTLPNLLTLQAERYGDKQFLTVADESFSFNEVHARAAKVGGLLAAHGVGPGDRVATLCGNRVELLDLFLGCGWIGAVLVPLNVESRGEGLRHSLRNCEPVVMAVEPDRLAQLEDADLPPSLRYLWSFGPASASPSPTLPQVMPYPAGGQDVPPTPVQPGDPVAILYTSGTSGVSKGVVCPHAQMYWWGVSVSEQLGITDSDVLYTCLPLFHTNALNAFVQALVAGAEFVVGRRFSASRFWSEIHECGATVTYLLGAMVNILWSRDESELDRSHKVRIALSPATPAALSEGFTERFGVVLLDGFGSTETNSVMSANPPRPGYLGRVQEDYEALVVDDWDSPVPDGTPGELLLRSRVPFGFALGYFKMPEATVDSWRNLWFHTGDRVVRDSDGWYRFLDRKKDVIRRRGENISSFELEHAIALLPQVEQVAGYPVPSDMAEDEVMVSVVLKSGTDLTPEELIEHCSHHLPRFAVPRFVDIVTDLPTTQNGKIRKNVLRDRGVTHSAWDSAEVR